MICMNVNDPDPFSYSTQGTLPWQPILWQNLDICINSAERRLMKIGPVTPEITMVTNAPF